MKGWLFGLTVIAACWPRDLHMHSSDPLPACFDSEERHRTPCRGHESRSKHSVGACVYETVDVPSGEFWMTSDKTSEDTEDE